MSNFATWTRAEAMSSKRLPSHLLSMNEKKYRFVRIRSFSELTDKGRWYLAADSVDAIMAHWRKYCKSEITKGTQELFDIRVRKMMKHYESSFGYLVSLELDLKGGNLIEKTLEVENRILDSRIDFYNKGTEQFLDKGLKVLQIAPGITEIVETVFSDEMVYPDEMSLRFEDVRYSQWGSMYGQQRGVHWYAKIGHLDIVDEQGRCKWNTKAEAEEAARKFIEKYNKEHSEKGVTER